MSKIGLTLTGADEGTRIEDLLRFADAGAEIGVLLTHSPDGRNRYPSQTWIAKVLLALGKRAALHICGQRARAKLFAGDLDGLLAKCGRVQINGEVEPSDLMLFCRRWHAKTVITQHTERNFRLAGLELMFHNHALLVDSSGGRGLSPSAWVRPDTSKLVGFAGGLGPDNLATELPRICEAAGDKPTWIDCENKIRDPDDWFDMEKAIRMAEVWKACNDEIRRARREAGDE